MGLLVLEDDRVKYLDNEACRFLKVSRIDVVNRSVIQLILARVPKEFQRAIIESYEAINTTHETQIGRIPLVIDEVVLEINTKRQTIEHNGKRISLCAFDAPKATGIMVDEETFLLHQFLKEHGVTESDIRACVGELGTPQTLSRAPSSQAT